MKWVIILVGILSWMTLGYILGMLFGAGLFDPDLDVWALASALFAIIGLLLGIFPYFRQRSSIALCALIGFYLSMLAMCLILGEKTLIDALGYASGFIVMSVSLITAGVVAAYRQWQAYAVPLFGLVVGAFLTPMILIVLAGWRPASELALAPLVVGCGIVWGMILYYYNSGFSQRELTR